MTENDKKAFGVLMYGMAENYSQHLSREGLAFRFEMLKAYDYAEIEQAAVSIIGSRQYATMPTVADFMERMGGGRVEDRAEVEAGRVLEAIGRVGGYASVVFDDPVTQAVIQNAYGGWPKLCETVGAGESEQWFRKNFAGSYAAYKRQGIQRHGYLAGRSEIGNGSKGIPHLERVAVIGDRAKAQEVLEAGQDAAALDLGARDLRDGIKSLLSGLAQQRGIQ